MAPTSDFLPLLSAIVPAFLHLAEFHTSNDPIAVAARAQLDLKESFYAKLHDELQVLNDILTAWDQTIPVPEGELTPVLDVFESRFIKRVQLLPSDLWHIQQENPSNPSMIVDKNQCSSNKKYARLRNLWHQLREAKNHDTNLKINDLRRLIRLKDARRQVRKHIVDRISRCNKELKRLTRKIAQPKHTSKARLSETDVTHILRPSLPASRVRENAKVLYRLLVRYWKCEGHEPHTSVKLRLGTHRGIIDEAKFNMLFCTRSGSPLKWQQGEAKVQFTERQSSESRKQKKVTWREDIIDKPQETTSVHYERWPVKNVCNLVQETAKMNSFRLNLVVENDLLWFMTASLITDDDHNQDFMSLGDFLTKSSAKYVKKTGRLILMVILSNAFLHFHEGPWFTRDWSKRNIYLSWSKDQVIPNLARPYISTKCDPREELPESKELDEVGASLLVHPYPSILALGILLLEIHLGRPIESERTNDALNDRGSLDAISYLSEAEVMLEECRGDSSQSFEEAVSACLDIFTFLEDSRQNMSLDDLVFRAKIHDRIVKPLEEELKAVSGYSVDELDSLASSKNFLHKIVSRQKKRITFAAPNSTTIANSTAAPSQMAVHQLGVYGDSGAVGTAEQKDSQQADDWFYTLNERVHPLIPVMEQSAIEASSCEGICTRQGEVRIAILDTGISLPEEHSWNFEDRIKDYKSWLRTYEDDETEDLDGHGTHAAALLLKTAPNANIYIARVFRDRKETRGNVTAGEIHRRVADAIIHAVMEWKVDIITMSFGFDEPVPIIEDAINLADREKIVMLAAASNNGGNDDIAWPARLDKVICIHATDSYGNPSDFTPTQCSYSDNFSILGQAVKSSWPPHLKQGTEIRKSGSSIATPIAAGIAAIVLDFLRQFLSRRAHPLPEFDAILLRKVRTTAGMKCIFRLMVPKKRRGYDYIAPWHLLDDEPHGLQSATVYDLIRKNLIGQS